MKKVILFLLSIPFFGLAQHEIKGTFSPAEDFTYAFLYYMTPSDPEFVVNTKVDSLGTAKITLDSLAKPGIYKIIYALPPEENNFDIIYNGKEDVVFNFSLKSGIEFTNSNENKLWASYLKSMDIINQTISNFYMQGGTDKTAFSDIFKTLKETQIAYENSSQNTLANTFIKANKSYMPENYEDLQTYSANLKNNYFSSVNFDDPLLQSSTFIDDKVEGFIFGLVENPDDETYKSHVDIVTKSLEPFSLKTKRNTLEKIWNRFVSIQNDAMANYISNFYLLDIAKEMNDTQLVDRLEAFKRTSIGTIAPDFDIDEETALSDLNEANNYLLIFWSSSCGHCLEELPQVKTLLEGNSDYKVVAFGIEDNVSSWSETIKNYPDFTHTIGLQKWNNPVVLTYGISATPTYFILSKDKKIISKPYDLEALKVFISKK